MTRWLAAALVTLFAFSAVASDCDVEAHDTSRVVVAGGSLTETLYFLGLEGHIVGVDTTSVFPQAASRHPSIGYVRRLSPEGVISLSPTMMLGEDDMGPPTVVSQVEKLGLNVVRMPETTTALGVVEKVRCVGRLFDAEEVAHHRIKSRLMPLVARLTKIAARREEDSLSAVVLLALRDGAPVVAGTGTSGDGLLRMIGIENALRDIDGWKPVSLETLSLAAPDAIIVTQRGLESAGGERALLQHPALRRTPAARNGTLVAMDGMALLGFGPRTLEAALDVDRLVRGRRVAASPGH